MSLLAVDVGSSACKAVMFASDGRVLAQASRSYAPEFPKPGFAEMDPEKFWAALCACCHVAGKDVAGPPHVLCISSHGETFVPVDAEGSPVAPAILNQDTRAVEQSRWCEKSIGRERLFQITGLFAHPMYPIPKILWLSKHEPRTYASAKSFVTLIGYLLLRMGLPALVDYSLASRFLAFDIRKRCWSEEILSATEIAEKRLPVPVPAGTIAGRLPSEAAGQLGVPAGIPVVLGGHDQPCGALGVGVVRSGRVCDSMGTYECLLASSDSPTLNDRALNACLNTYCHVVPDQYVTLAYFPAGIMLKWFHDLLFAGCASEEHAATVTQEVETNRYASLERNAPPGPSGVCITPHLIGTCNPEFNPHTRAWIAGLNVGTTHNHLYKGILEGLACELSMLTEALAEAVGGFEDIYVTGGGTRSTLGLQLRAALAGRRLHVMKGEEAVCLGTAMVAGVAIGEYKSVREAIETLVEECKVVVPDEALAASYREQMRQYRDLRAVAVRGI